MAGFRSYAVAPSKQNKQVVVGEKWAGHQPARDDGAVGAPAETCLVSLSMRACVLTPMQGPPPRRYPICQTAAKMNLRI